VIRLVDNSFRAASVQQISGFFMKFRDHPLMIYEGSRVWPPAWVPTRATSKKIPRGEVGFLKEVRYDPSGRGGIVLLIEYEGAEFIGCLIFDSSSFCESTAKYLADYCGTPLEKIGDSDISLPS
jgi:hypothetical protein